jgi:putative nucleotidyltransferase with HDIG domain
MFGSPKSSARRLAIREHRPDSTTHQWNRLKRNGTFPSVAIAGVFWVLATAIMLMRQDVLPYRPGQSVRYDILSRVDFSYKSKDLYALKQEQAKEHTPRVYRSTVDGSGADIWQPFQEYLLSLPTRVGHLSFGELPPDLKSKLDSGTLTALQRYESKSLQAKYDEAVKSYISQIRAQRWVILPADQWQQEAGHDITLLPGNLTRSADSTFPSPPNDELKSDIIRLADDSFRLELQPKIIAMTIAAIQPTYMLDEDQTAYARNTAAASVPEKEGTIHVRSYEPIVHKGVIDTEAWQKLRAENQAFLAAQDRENGSWFGATLKSDAGLAVITLLLTMAIGAYTAYFQPRVIRNHARGISIVALLLSMLLLAQLAGMGTGPIYWIAIAPTLLVGIILSIAYDQRFAVGLASIHALLVTIGLDQRAGFLLVCWIGLTTACFQLKDIRSRSKLIEVGGLAAIAMMAATAAWGMLSLDGWQFIANNCLYAGAAGLSVGFIVLGILPFIEKSFRITTSMTLLELADASHSLLRRLAVEAPGTYSHSLQVATLAEAAAEAIGANSLLCRVAAYYHDIGKINKPDYFVENQQPGQQNRHINLTPSVSFLIIKGHVMDGMEMAREYNLPRNLLPFIQQHHGTTLVEYFYNQACSQMKQRGEDASVSDTEFRYPGPKPRSREVGILMLSDCVESATRAMKEPSIRGIDELVHTLTMRRLLDGQFDDCELTMKDLNKIEKTLAKTLQSIHHGRIAYPSTASLTDAVAAPPSVRLG